MNQPYPRIGGFRGHCKSFLSSKSLKIGGFRGYFESFYQPRSDQTGWVKIESATLTPLN